MGIQDTPTNRGGLLTLDYNRIAVEGVSCYYDFNYGFDKKKEKLNSLAGMPEKVTTIEKNHESLDDLGILMRICI